MDPILAGRKTAQHLPHAEPEADPGNQVVGSNHQQRGPLTRWHSQHVHPLTTTPPSLDWSRQQDAGRQDPQGPAVRRACIRQESSGSSPATIQRRV